MVGITGIIEHEVNQRSEEWFALRCGKLTGSHFAEIMPSSRAKTPWTKAQEKVLYRIAAERITGLTEPRGYVSDAMQWGIDHEEEAIEAVCRELLISWRPCGIFQRGEFVASSPDAILRDNSRTLEIKCPASKTHLQYLNDPSLLWDDYKWQVLGEAFCTGIFSPVIASYDPRFPEDKRLLIYEPEGYQEDLQRLKVRLGEVEIAIEELCK